MRAYKFRSWHKGSGDMIVDAYPGQCFQWLRERQPIEIMQFTGLHDKSGREIYEGDRVKISCHIECESANCRVGWFNDRWWVFTDRNQQGVMEECKLPLGELAQSIDKEGKYSRVEVIGNIHENPDLVTP